MKRLVVSSLLAAIVFAAGPAWAQGLKAEGIYLGGSLGVGTVKQTIEGVEVIDDATFGLKLLGGYRTRFLAIELDYRNLGTAKGLSGSIESKTTGFMASVLAMLPIGPIDLFGRGGAFIHNVNTALDPTSADGLKLDDTTFAYGLGLALRIGSFSVRGEAERLDIATQDKTWMYSLGITIAF